LKNVLRMAEGFFYTPGACGARLPGMMEPGMPLSVRPLVVIALLAACGPRLATRPAPEPGFEPDRAKAEVEWLADPARTGRGTGTPGGPAAAGWIAERLAEAGVPPAFDAGYLQTFEAPFRATLGSGNALVVVGSSPEPRHPALVPGPPPPREAGAGRGERDHAPGAATAGDGFLPFGFSDDGAVEAEVVFAGYGITAPELGYDDYAGIDVKGKVVLVAQDFPRESDPASPFRDPRAYRYGEWRYKATNAREHGAAALIGVRDVWAHEGADDLPPWRGQVSSRVGLVAVRATARTLRAGGIAVPALAAPGEADGRPHSRTLGVRARVAAEIHHESAVTANVVAALPGRDPAVAGHCVVIGAHHDHLGWGGDASLAPEQVGTVHPGADDNASGVAALLAVARALAAAGPARRTVVFAAFGAEELGILGSGHLVRHMPPGCPAGALQLMVNLDMVGRAQAGKVYVDGATTARGLREITLALATRSPRLPLTLAFGGDGYGPSDHASFRARGVPVLFLFTGAHGDYHRPGDTPEKLDFDRLAAIARLAARVVREAADGAPLEPLKAAAASPPAGSGERERGYGAYLGAIPDFAARKAPGVLLTGVRAGSPAEQAGLAAGDVLLRLGATRLLSLQDLAFALRAHRPGEEVELEWDRGGRRSAGTVRLGARR
jgi:hypothetical protein